MADAPPLIFVRKQGSEGDVFTSQAFRKMLDKIGRMILKHDPNKRSRIMRLHIGGSRLRKVVMSLPTHEAQKLLLTLFAGELTPRQAELIVTYPDETTVSGAYLTLPESWGDLTR